ncbi:hypothetical protein EXD82_07780 [Peptacetobacter hominis]|uniref:Molecular chaperone DnaJ n=1 Tax=Peptacetobacter hominis TaxID=2743610 RepID=A0A544QU45_9FIRM|nr:hypothetical protein [Peptacetobacter hominis]TQQ84226.1 hypothetical protein EXD82_07780 [Peptacetobacter hominis]
MKKNENVIDINEKIDLMKEYELVSDNFVDILMDRINNIIKKDKQMRALYQCHFGTYEVKRIELMKDITIYSKIIEEINAYVCEGKEIDCENLRMELEAEKAGFDESVSIQKRAIEDSKDYLNRKKAEKEELEYMDKVFRRLIKKYHPVLSDDITTEDSAILNNVLDAYIDENVSRIVLFENYLENNTKTKNKSMKENELKERISDIRGAIDYEIVEMMNEKSNVVFTIGENLTDFRWIEEKKELLKNQLKDIEEKKNRIIDRYNIMRKLYNVEI